MSSSNGKPAQEVAARAGGLANSLVGGLGRRIATELLRPSPRLPLPRRRNLPKAVEDKRILITGASSGIGRESALRIGEAGGEVLLVARRRGELEEVASEIRRLGGRAHVFPTDLSETEQVEALVERAIEDHGGVDILVNNAGHSIRRALEESYERFHDFERTMRLNYFGPVRLILGFLPGMRERGFGHIVNISTMGTQVGPSPRFPAYLASKAALDAFADSAAPETLHDGIHWTTVYMPLVRTPMIDPSPHYRQFPSLNAREASDMVVDSIVRRPRWSSTRLGDFGEIAYRFSPRLSDRVMNVGYRRSPD
jgi:NAD(P)-dependent dehydrogenase (short-subunit alcohol dehydrogenase family)